MKQTRSMMVVSLLALGVALVLWAVLGGDKPQSVMMPDGTRLTLRAVQAGTNCSYDFASPLQRMTGRLPWKWAKGLSRERVVRNPSDHTNLVVWFTCSTNTPLAHDIRFSVIHDRGTNNTEIRLSPRTQLPSGEQLLVGNSRLWPRRSRFVTLRAYKRDTQPGAGYVDFRVRNPLYAEYPEWQPEILPGVRTMGDTTFTLERLVETPATYWKQYPDCISLEASLRISRTGRTADEWDVIGMQFRDATGNQYHWLARSMEWRSGGERRIGMVCPMMAGERAGKLGIAFVNTKQTDTNDVFVMRAVSLKMDAGMPWRAYNLTNRFANKLIVSVAQRFSNDQSRGFVVDGLALSVTSVEPHLYDLAVPKARLFLPLKAKDDLNRTFTFTNSPLDLANFQRLLTLA